MATYQGKIRETCEIRKQEKRQQETPPCFPPSYKVPSNRFLHCERQSGLYIPVTLPFSHPYIVFLHEQKRTGKDVAFRPLLPVCLTILPTNLLISYRVHNFHIFSSSNCHTSSWLFSCHCRDSKTFLKKLLKSCQQRAAARKYNTTVGNISC